MAVCFPAIYISPSFLPSIVTTSKQRRLSAVKSGFADGDVTQYVTESRKQLAFSIIITKLVLKEVDNIYKIIETLVSQCSLNKHLALRHFKQ